jgi:hypothetical protein
MLYPWKDKGLIMNALDRLATTGKMIDQGIAPAPAPQGMAMAPQGQGMKKGGKVSSASKRADGCCIRGKTKA